MIKAALLMLMSACLSAQSLSIQGAEMSASDAFSLGKSFGDSGKDDAAAGITSQTASDRVPGYAATSNETMYYQDGMGNLSEPASANVQECLDAPTTESGADKQKYGRCETIRMIHQSKGKARAMFTLDPTKDPMITKSKAITKNPSEYTGSMGAGGYSGCVDTVVKDPDIYEEMKCEKYRELEDQSCLITNNVTIRIDQNCVPDTYTFRTSCGGGWAAITSARCDVGKEDISISHEMVGSNYGRSYFTESVLDNRNANQEFVGAVRDPSYPNNVWYYVYKEANSGCTSGNCSYTYSYYLYYYRLSGRPINVGTYICTSTLNFEKPRSLVIEEDNWDNQCKSFEDRAK